MTTVDETEPARDHHDAGTTPPPVLVIGGTGTTGSRVVRELRAAGIPVRSASRRPAGEDAVAFDWYDDAGRDVVLRGVSGIYLVPPVGEVDPTRVVVPFLRRAREHGVQRVVLASAAAVETGGPGVGEVAASLPELVDQAVVLRPSWFMQNFTGDHPQARSLRDHDEVVSATGDGRVPFVDADDIAAVAATLLRSPDPIGGELLLTGPEALGYDDVAAVLGRVSGRRIAHRRVGVEELAREIFSDLPPDFAAVLAGLDVAIAAGAFGQLGEGVRRTTGREPTSFDDFATRHRDVWASA